MLKKLFTQRLAQAAIVSLVAFFLASSAFGYSYLACEGNPIKWNSWDATMSISTTSFPPGTPTFNLINNAMAHWNGIQGSGFEYSYSFDFDGSHASGNGVNEVYFTGLSGSTLGVTLTTYHCYWLFGWQYGIDETDIGMDSSSISWSTSAYNYANPTGSPFSFESVMLHELGHALGLKHEDDKMATMNSFYPNSGPFGYYKEWDPHGDDRQGARFLYPDLTFEIDLVGAVLKRTGAGSSNVLSCPNSAADGTVVSVDFSFGNLGQWAQTFDVKFYLSTNDFITTGDTLLGTNVGASVNPGFTITGIRNLLIPFGTPPGNYYIGFIVDGSDAIAEGDEYNNLQSMSHPITIF